MNQGETVLLIDWIIPSARGLRLHGFTRDSKYWHCCRIQVCLVPGCFPIIFNCFVNLYRNEPVSFSIVAFPSISRTATKESTVFATHSALSKMCTKIPAKRSEKRRKRLGASLIYWHLLIDWFIDWCTGMQIPKRVSCAMPVSVEAIVASKFKLVWWRQLGNF